MLNVLTYMRTYTPCWLNHTLAFRSVRVSIRKSRMCGGAKVLYQEEASLASLICSTFSVPCSLLKVGRTDVAHLLPEAVCVSSLNRGEAMPGDFVPACDCTFWPTTAGGALSTCAWLAWTNKKPEMMDSK